MKLQIKESQKTQLVTPSKVSELFNSLLELEDKIGKEQEHFWVIMLDTRSVVKGVDLISLGTINATIIHPREVFRRAIIEGATSIIVGHNHPSNDVKPSSQDIEITKKLSEAGKMLEISLIDHIIISNNSLSFYSMKQESDLQ